MLIFLKSQKFHTNIVCMELIMIMCMSTCMVYQHLKDGGIILGIDV